MTTSRPQVGIVGTGRIGIAVCARLADGGFSIIANDRRGELREAVIETGAQWADTAAETAARCDVLLTVLPGPAELVAARDSLIDALRPGSTWIDMTTANPALAEEIANSARDREVRTLDAPLAGDPVAARTGQLLVFIGAHEADLESHRRLLEHLAGTIIHVGKPGSGYTMKLLVNLLWFGQAVANAEALSLAVRAGLDPWAVRSAVQQSAAANRFMERDAVALLSGDDLTSYALGRCHDQLRMVLSLGRELEVPLALGDRVTELYAQALQRYGDLDGELLAARLIAERAHVDFTAGPPTARNYNAGR
jgi:3-hydroxyisobutyrate dehydrogenase